MYTIFFKVTDLLSGKTVSVRRDSGNLVGVSEASMDGVRIGNYRLPADKSFL